MREIVFDLTRDSYFPKSAFGGFEGEHNATSLTLLLPERLLADDAIYYMVFETANNDEVIFSAPLLSVENAISTTLPKQVMTSPRVTVHAAAYRKDGEALAEIAKSPRVILEIKYPEAERKTELSRDGGGIPGLVIESAILPESENPVSSRALYDELSMLEGGLVQSAFVNEAGELILKKKNREQLNAGSVIGPQGDKGDKGDKGERGEQGEQGEPGVSNIYYKYDFDGNGVVDQDDAEHLNFHTSDPAGYPIPWWCEPDVNGDGVVNIDDAIALTLALQNGDPSAFAIVPKSEIVDDKLSATSKKPIQTKAVSNSVANALKGRVSGTAVAMKDVSPLEHEIAVKLSSDTVNNFSAVTLKKYGKNILPHPQADTSTKPLGVTFTPNADGSVTVNGELEAALTRTYTIGRELDLRDGVTYAMPSLREKNLSMYVIYKDPTSAKPNEDKQFESSFTWKKEYQFVRTCLLARQIENFDNAVVYPWVEVGSVATEYEPYKEPVSFTPNADGTVNDIIGSGAGITLMTDTEGVTIDATYNRDLNKAFAEIYQAIATMGAAAATIPEEI